MTDARYLTPNMIRISVEAIGDWTWPTAGIGDEKIDLAFPRAGESVADVAYFNRADYGSASSTVSTSAAASALASAAAASTSALAEPPWRHYTVRNVRNGGACIDIDFVVHDGGHASEWAARAKPGHVLGVFTVDESRSYYWPPAHARRQLLVADSTGLPGLGRIVEGLPAGTVAHAFVEVQSDEDRQSFETVADVSYTWLVGTGLGRSRSALPAAVEEWMPPAGLDYAWVACEAAASRRIRRHLRTVHGLERRHHIAVGYWTDGHTGHFEQDDRVVEATREAHDHDHDHDHDHEHDQASPALDGAPQLG